MKISIITIVLNDKNNIEKTILSVLNQKDVNLEYIIIDGGSTDGTLEIIEKYKDQIDVFISEKDNGIVDAFNKGLKLAKGDIIGIINSGDWLEPNVMSFIKQTFERTQADVVYGDVLYWKDNLPEYRYKADHTLLKEFMSINHPAVFVKKVIYEKYGLFDETFKFAMDYELMLRFFINNVKFVYINRVLSNMALGGVSDKNWRLAYKEAYEIRKKYLGRSINLYLKYLFQVFKRDVSNLFSKIGLESVRKFYKKHFSKIKKVKYENNL